MNLYLTSQLYIVSIVHNVSLGCSSKQVHGGGGGGGGGMDENERLSKGGGGGGEGFNRDVGRRVVSSPA